MKIVALTRPPSIDASSRHRVYQFVNILKKKYNIDVCVIPYYTNEEFEAYKKNQLSIWRLSKIFARRISQLTKINKYDIVWISRGVLPIELVSLVKLLSKNSKIVYDFDDAIYLNEGSFRIRRLLARSWISVPKYTKLANAVLVGNYNLANWARQLNQNVTVVPTVLSVNDYPVKKYSEDRSDNFTIGWIGTISTAPNLEIIRSSLLRLSEKNEIRFVEIGANYFKDLNHSNFSYLHVPWSEKNQTKWLSEFDVGVAPLYNSEFNLGKCGFKIIQYMASGIPVIGSPVGVQSQIIQHNATGFLANSEEEWFEYFTILLKNHKIRNNFGNKARQVAEQNYDVQVAAKEIHQVFSKLMKN